MAKTENALVVATAKSVEAHTDHMQMIQVGDKQMAVTNLVNLPTLKHETGEIVAIRIDAPIREEVSYKEEEVIVQGVKQVATRENIINVVRVTELSSGSPFEYVCNAMTADNLRSAYPENGYVGRSFAIAKGDTVQGKRYKATQIVELADVVNVTDV